MKGLFKKLIVYYKEKLKRMKMILPLISPTFSENSNDLSRDLHRNPVLPYRFDNDLDYMLVLLENENFDLRQLATVFESAWIEQLIQVVLLRHRLCLIQILGASLSKFSFSSRTSIYSVQLFKECVRNTR